MYRITTYPQGKLSLLDFTEEALRAHKATKGRLCVQGQQESFESLEDLVLRASQVPITAALLKQNKREKQAFIETNLIVFDVDSNYTLEEALFILEKSEYKYALYTSFSHAKWGKDKFHVIIPTDKPIVSEDEYKATYKHASFYLFNNNNDSQTSSPSNLFFNSNEETRVIKVKEIGKDYPKQYSITASSPSYTSSGDSKKLSRRTLSFLSDGAADGHWHKELILAIKNLKAAGYEKEDAILRLKKITGDLTQEDLYQIDKGYEYSTFVYNTTLVKDIHPLRLKYMSDKGKTISIPASEIVKTYFEENHVLCHLNGQHYQEGIPTPLNVLAEYIRDFSDKELRQDLSIAKIHSIIQANVFNMRKKRFEELKNYVEYDGSEFNFSQLCEAITGETNPLIERIIKHFLWQVKRKMWDKKVIYHIMPVLVGKSGSGKSELVYKMVEPIKDIAYMDGDFKKLVDTRESHNLTENYVYFIDEMSKAEYSDVDTIKNKITSNTIQYRILGTNSTVSGKNTTTFIGASNTRIEFVIKDETSSRRFFQIITLDKMKWGLINSFDYLKMWKSIDENAENPYIADVYADIVEAQKGFKHMSIVEHFIKETMPNLSSIEGEGRISRQELFSKFKEYKIQAGYTTSMGKHLFCEKLRYHVGESQRGLVNGVYCDFYYLKE